MSDLDRLLSEPKPPTLSHHFSQRVMANLPPPRSQTARFSPWLRAYWILFSFFAIWQVASLPLPQWSLMLLTPVAFGVLAASATSWRKILAPLLR